MELNIKHDFEQAPKQKIKEAVKLEEVSLVVNNLSSAQEAVTEAIKYIMKRKNMNVPVITNIIGESLITAIDEASELFPNVRPEKKKMLAKRLSKFLTMFALTIGK